MGQAFVDEGPGESRLAVMEGGRLVVMAMARDGDGVAPGARVAARWKGRAGPGGIAVTEAGEEIFVGQAPRALAEGGLLLVEVVRAAWLEPGRRRLARGRVADRAAGPAVAPTLAGRARAAGHALGRGWPDAVEAAWREGWEAAAQGRIELEGGAASLGFWPTPATLAIDCDAAAPLAPGLAARVAADVARAIGLWGLGGSLFVDFAGTPPRAERAAAAAAFDAAMAAAGLPFERTAISGFGTMQIVRPRGGPSILERARLERDANAANALLRAAIAEPMAARALRLVARAGVIGWLDARPHVMAEAARRAGRPLRLEADARGGEGHVAREA